MLASKYRKNSLIKFNEIKKEKKIHHNTKIKIKIHINQDLKVSEQ